MTEPFQIIIQTDALAELTELFEVDILPNPILNQEGRTINLTVQERGRIAFDIDHAWIFILDANSKFCIYSRIAPLKIMLNRSNNWLRGN